MSFTGQISSELPAARPAAEASPSTWPGLVSWRKALVSQALYGAGRSLVGATMHLTLDVDIQYLAPLPAGPKILAANHPTSTDPFYILPLLSEPVGVLITAAAFDVPIFGAYLRAAGHVPAVRGSGGATVAALTRQVEAGRSVVIFPEGALSPLAGGFHRPHSGVALVALQTRAPVIPIGIGVRRDRIRVTETEVDGAAVIGHLYTSGPYAVTVGQPLTFEGDAGNRERVRAAAAHIMHHIRILACESESRIRRAQAALADCLPASAGPVGVP